MSEIDLDELRSELSDFAQPEKKGRALRRKNASLRASRRYSGS
jgi:hypothetical protein